MSVKTGWVQFYLADIRPLYQEKTQRYVYEHLGEERRRKADACRMPGARAASLAAGFLAQYALQDNGYAGWRVCYGKAGQPLMRKERGPKDDPAPEKVWEDGIRTEEAPYISLSHSGDYAVCAISDSPVGVDIQKIQRIRQNMLRHFFTEEEEQAFRKRYGLEECRTGQDDVPDSAAILPHKSACFLSEDAAREFLRLWTVKESYMKLTGTGLALGLSNVAVDLERGEVCERMPVSENGIDSRMKCIIRELKAPDGYFLTACIGGGKAMNVSFHSSRIPFFPPGGSSI